MQNKKNLIIVIGGQFGSEAKGKHVQDLCHSRREITSVVRTGAPNAGHSMAVFEDGIEEEGCKYVAMQILPCGWTAKNIHSLFVGVGAQVIPDMMVKEFALVRQFSGASVYVDKGAMIQTEGDAEAEVGDGMSAKIGSTSKGCGAALARRISRRDPTYMNYETVAAFSGGKMVTDEMLPPACDVTAMINDEPGMVLVEGTQGHGLSIYHGPYPHTTSRDTGAAQWLAEAGLSPMQVAEIHMVCRTYPIRVAGNSGPMRNELCWSYFFKKAGLDKAIIEDFQHCKAMLEEQNFDPRTLIREVCVTMQEKHGEAWGPFKAVMEFTTVTKLPRRIGAFDFVEFEKAVMINRPTHVALEFCNYVTAEHYGIKEVTPLMPYVHQVDGAPIRFGKVTAEEFSKLCSDNSGMAELHNLVASMDEVLQKWGAGHVTHLGVSRDATLEIVH